METRINAGANATFTPEQVTRKMLIENRHNVEGNIQYRIGIAPIVTVQVKPNEPPIEINHPSSDLIIWNNLANSIYCIYE
ncbi:hypothetical protein [Tenacibaculum ovolyticum]|uniref:hypothetical protein n=1 Tax=Tenacibaculum ovolyticum TaxID=104270 RepID=UPI003BAAE636